MQCPACDERLREVERYGVMVDICPGCKGVWLDRGELEKVAGMEKRDDLERGEQGQRKPKGSFLSDLLGGFGD
jgi:Zn-finger nucleic acid-binding protein